MYQLLEIVDGDVSVCVEYGEHAELSIPDVMWVSIYKHNSYVSLSNCCLGVIAKHAPDLETAKGKTLYELGTRFQMDFGDGMLLVDPVGDADGVFRGELSIRNDGSTLARKKRRSCLTEADSSNDHRISLTQAELLSLVPIEELVRAFDRANSLGLMCIGNDDDIIECGRRNSRKHLLTPTQQFRFAAITLACEFTSIGELVLRPFHLLDCAADGCDCKNETLLSLTREEAARILEFNETKVRNVVPRAGLVYRIDAKRSVGVWRHERYFPEANEEDQPSGMRCFAPAEWRWFCACLRLYVAFGNYLHRRDLAPSISELNVTNLITATRHHL